MNHVNDHQPPSGQTEDFRRRMADSDRVSQALATHMLQGWAMLADHCPRCATPLVRSRTGDVRCVGCNMAVSLEPAREDDDSTEQDTTATQQQQEQQPPQIPHRSTVGDPITTPKATPRSTHPTPSPAPPALHTGNNVSHMESHIGQEHALQHTLPREGLGVLQGALCRKIAQVSKALDALSIGQTVGDHESCATLVSLAEQLVRVHTHVVEAQGTRS